MKTLKVIFFIFGILVLLLIAGGGYVKMALPNTGPPPKLIIKVNEKRLENGRYLANHVTICVDCHSKRNWALFAGPLSGDSLGEGGEVFNREMGFPGIFYSPNITQAKLKDWSDGEIFRAVTTGVSKDGRALFPLMPAHRFGKMDKEDIYDIIAYVRTLKPIEKDIPKSEIDFPVNFLVNTMPQKASFVKKPDPVDSIQYGAYLVNAAGCVDCHSKVDNGQIVSGTEFGGGMEFPQPAGILRSPNISPHSTYGIGTWTKAQFIKRFKVYTSPDYKPAQITLKDLNTPMPWSMYSGMKDRDLGAIFDYLKTLTPKENQVARFSPPKN